MASAVASSPETITWCEPVTPVRSTFQSSPTTGVPLKEIVEADWPPAAVVTEVFDVSFVRLAAKACSSTATITIVAPEVATVKLPVTLPASTPATVCGVSLTVAVYGA